MRKMTSRNTGVKVNSIRNLSKVKVTREQRMRNSLFAEKAKLFDTAYVFYNVWVDEWEFGHTKTGGVIAETKRISGYGATMEEAQANAEKRARQFFNRKITGRYGGGFQVMHGKRYLADAKAQEERYQRDRAARLSQGREQ